MMILLEARDIFKTYTDMASPVEVLRGVDFCLSGGELVGIFGSSGSGKSTLLHILGGLDRPTAGVVLSGDVDIASLNDEGLSCFRNRKIGFVFQFYHLLPEFTALENVMMPALIAGESKRAARELAHEALSAMGLEDRLSHRPSMLSGGEQQRVALARAAVLAPPVILADEPTGNLDSETGARVWEYLLSLNSKRGMALAIVTHNRDLLREFRKTFELRDGKLHQLDDSPQLVAGLPYSPS